RPGSKVDGGRTARLGGALELAVQVLHASAGATHRVAVDVQHRIAARARAEPLAVAVLHALAVGRRACRLAIAQGHAFGLRQCRRGHLRGAEDADERDKVQEAVHRQILVPAQRAPKDIAAVVASMAAKCTPRAASASTSEPVAVISRTAVSPAQIATNAGTSIHPAP